jgi:hypothetical protein
MVWLRQLPRNDRLPFGASKAAQTSGGGLFIIPNYTRRDVIAVTYLESWKAHKGSEVGTQPQP